MAEERESAPAEERDASGDSSLVGLGVDIIEIARMERVLERTPRFRQRVFTEAERAYCDAKPNPTVHYALFFAAKEAVLKALGTGFRGMGIRDVEVAHNRFGRPIAVLSGHAAEEARLQGIREIFLSLSYTHTTGVASAVAAREEHIPAKRAASDAQAKLDERFRDLRALLDEIDAKLTEIENAQRGAREDVPEETPEGASEDAPEGASDNLEGKERQGQAGRSEQ